MKNDKLYDFLMEHETGISKHNGYIEAWVHVPYCGLGRFLEIVQPEYERYPKCELQETSACVVLTDILDEEIKDYKDCFSRDDWDQIFGGAR